MILYVSHEMIKLGGIPPIFRQSHILRWLNYIEGWFGICGRQSIVRLPLTFHRCKCSLKLFLSSVWNVLHGFWNVVRDGHHFCRRQSCESEMYCYSLLHHDFHRLLISSLANPHLDCVPPPPHCVNPCLLSLNHKCSSWYRTSCGWNPFLATIKTPHCNNPHKKSRKV